MPDLLIRDLSQEDLDSLDEAARRAGMSRAEHVRRLLHGEAQRARRPVTREDFEWLAEVAADVLEPDFEERAWGMTRNVGD